eukprot:403352267
MKEQQEIMRMKRQFARELKCLIESEISKQHQEKHNIQKVVQKTLKLEKLEEEKKVMEQAKQIKVEKLNRIQSQQERKYGVGNTDIQKVLENIVVQDKNQQRNSLQGGTSGLASGMLSRRGSMKSLFGLGENIASSDFQTSMMTMDQQISEGTKRKAEALIRLKQKNEEKMKKAEYTKTVKELEEEEKKLKLLKNINESESKLNLSIDLQKMDQIRRIEERKKRTEEKKLIQEELSARDYERQTILLQKIQKTSHRADLLQEHKQKSFTLKSELDKQRFQEQQEKYLTVKINHQQQQQDILKRHEQKKQQASKFLQQKSEIYQVKQNLTKEFHEKKSMIMQKLLELKKSGKGIEEIYKYTNDIIFEEEDEEEDQENNQSNQMDGLDDEHIEGSILSQSAQKDQNILNQNLNNEEDENYGQSFTQRSKSVNQVVRSETKQNKGNKLFDKYETNFKIEDASRSSFEQQEMKRSGSKSVLMKSLKQKNSQLTQIDMSRDFGFNEYESQSVGDTIRTRNNQSELNRFESLENTRNQDIKSISNFSNVQGNQGKTYSDKEIIIRSKQRPSVKQQTTFQMSLNKSVLPDIRRSMQNHQIKQNSSNPVQIKTINNRYGNAQITQQLIKVSTNDPYRQIQNSSTATNKSALNKYQLQNKRYSNNVMNEQQNSSYEAYQIYTGQNNNKQQSSLYVPVSLNQSQIVSRNSQLNDSLSMNQIAIPRRQQMPVSLNQSYDMIQPQTMSNMKPLPLKQQNQYISNSNQRLEPLQFLKQPSYSQVSLDNFQIQNINLQQQPTHQIHHQNLELSNCILVSKSNSLNQTPIVSSSQNQSRQFTIPQSVPSVRNINNENSFLLELTRKRQKEEILMVIREEEKIERDRLSQLKDPQIEPDQKSFLEHSFNIERNLAQQRIEKLMKQHDEQIKELQQEQKISTFRQQMQVIQQSAPLNAQVTQSQAQLNAQVQPLLTYGIVSSTKNNNQTQQANHSKNSSLGGRRNSLTHSIDHNSGRAYI